MCQVAHVQAMIFSTAADSTVNLALQVFEWQMCSEKSLDSHRFKDAIEQAISDGTVKRRDWCLMSAMPSAGQGTKQFACAALPCGCVDLFPA